MVLVEPGDGGFESEFAAGDLQPLDEVGGAGEQHAPTVFDKGEAESCRQSASCRRQAARTDSRLAPLPNQASPAASAMTCALLTTGTASKSKVSRVLPGGSRASARWRSMRRRLALGHLMLGQAARKRAAGQPSLSAWAASVGPDLLDSGQPQLGEEQREAGGVDWDRSFSCRTSARTVPSSS